MTNLVAIKLIKIGERTRDLNLAHRDELVKDIRKNGLLHPLVLGDGEGQPLIDGLHRLSALEVLHLEQFPIIYDGETIPHNCVPFVRFADLEPSRLLEAEIAANLYRRELTWQERNDALARLHRMQGASPDGTPATFLDTAAKLVGATGKSLSTTRNAISRAIVLSDAAAADPSLLSARSEAEAFTRLKSDITRLSTSLLADGFAATDTLHTLIEGDLKSHLPSLQPESLDLILADPPYGVGADNWSSKFQDAPHLYKDTWEHAAELYAHIATYGFAACKPMANMFLFCTIERWHQVRDIVEATGWVTWPHPLIWHKSNEGIRPWGAKGYAYCYEAILFATKGSKGLIRTGPDVITDIYKVRDREHGAAKPPALYRHLMESSSLPGSTVLDPCCGSGTVFEAATLANMIAIGMENDPVYIGMSQSRMRATVTELSTAELDFI